MSAGKGFSTTIGVLAAILVCGVVLFFCLGGAWSLLMWIAGRPKAVRANQRPDGQNAVRIENAHQQAGLTARCDGRQSVAVPRVLAVDCLRRVGGPIAETGDFYGSKRLRRW